MPDAFGGERDIGAFEVTRGGFWETPGGLAVARRTGNLYDQFKNCVLLTFAPFFFLPLCFPLQCSPSSPPHLLPLLISPFFSTPSTPSTQSNRPHSPTIESQRIHPAPNPSRIWLSISDLPGALFVFQIERRGRGYVNIAFCMYKREELIRPIFISQKTPNSPNLHLQHHSFTAISFSAL